MISCSLVPRSCGARALRLRLILGVKSICFRVAIVFLLEACDKSTRGLELPFDDRLYLAVLAVKIVVNFKAGGIGSAWRSRLHVTILWQHRSGGVCGFWIPSILIK